MRKNWWIALLVFAADRLSKWAAGRMTGPAVLIPGLLGLRYTENTGMAFSLFSGMPALLGLVSLIVVAAGLAVLRRFRLGPVSRTGAMLVLGGALGNMWDRFFTGYVADMIEVLAFRFAVFNVADASLTVGCVLLGVSLIFCGKEWEKKDGTDGG